MAALPRFQLRDLADPPVIVAYVPRGGGASTLLGSLLIEGQRDARIAGAVVVTDRLPPGGTYMGGIGGLVRDACPSAVLASMIEYQRGSGGGVGAMARLALVVDDVASSTTRKALKNEAFQTRLKMAKDYNIMVLIATSDVNTLPANVPTFATHVMTTRSVFVNDAKVAQKRLFPMLSGDELSDVLKSCLAYQFVVGVLRGSGSSSGSGSGSASEDESGEGPEAAAAPTPAAYAGMLQMYAPTYYVRDATCAAPQHMWPAGEGGCVRAPESLHCATFTMAPPLVALLSAAVDSRSSAL
jgi:hypothetical protein